MNSKRILILNMLFRALNTFFKKSKSMYLFALATSIINCVLFGFVLVALFDLQEKLTEVELMQKDYAVRYDSLKKMRNSFDESPLHDGCHSEVVGHQEDDFILLNRDQHHLEETVLVHPAEEKPPTVVKKIVASAHMAAQKSAQKSAQKTSQYLFVWPIDDDLFWISSYYGRRERKRFHAGIDMAAARGTPVKAAADGRVEVADFAGSFGSMVLLKHDKQYKTRYAHLSKIIAKPGSQVKKGQLIGLVGNSGRVTGKNGFHLHFEVLSFGNAVNPLHHLA